MLHRDLKRPQRQKGWSSLGVRTNNVKLARQERGAAVLRHVLVSRVVFEKVAFRIEDWFRRVDAALAIVCRAGHNSPRDHGQGVKE